MSNKILMLLSIVGRNKGKKLIKTLDNNNIRLHLQTTGFGTAPSEMMDILGLSGNDKDIIISYGTESSVKTLMRSFSDSFASYSEYGGLLMILKLSSINRLTSEIVTRTKTAGEIGDDEIMNNNHKHNLIIISVSQGFVDDVMRTAKQAGAMGGTVIRGRLAETNRLKEIANIDIEEEREIILIMAPDTITNTIMDEVNKSFGLKTEARGILCSVPIEKAYKI